MGNLFVRLLIVVSLSRRASLDAGDVELEDVVVLGGAPEAPSRLFQWGPAAARVLRFTDGVSRRLVTRSAAPAVFEVEHFLDEAEVLALERLAAQEVPRASGLKADGAFRYADQHRVSSSSFVPRAKELRELPRLAGRIAELLRMPVEVVSRTEDMQVVRYAAGGHYVPHFDSEGLSRPSGAAGKERLRFATLLYGIREADEGGETGFPNSGGQVPFPRNRSAGGGRDDAALEAVRACSPGASAKLRRGHALLWYNHGLADVEPARLGSLGDLGEVEDGSCHMACEVHAGEKIVANHWITLRPSSLPFVQPVLGPIAPDLDYLIYRKPAAGLWSPGGPQARILNELDEGDVIVWLLLPERVTDAKPAVVRGLESVARRAIAGGARGVRFAWAKGAHGRNLAVGFGLDSSLPALAMISIGARESQDNRSSRVLPPRSMAETCEVELSDVLVQINPEKFASALRSGPLGRASNSGDEPMSPEEL